MSDNESADGPQTEPAPEAPQAADEMASAEQQLAEARAEAGRYLANWQRAQADFVNYKRRVEGERDEVGRLATAALLINLLPTVDDLERALSSVDVKLAGLTWVDGIRLIYRKFQAVLETAGVSEIAAEGHDFDPKMHEAVMYAEGDDGKVIREVQRGYRLGARVIRPAMVVVGRRDDGGEPAAAGPADEDEESK